MKEGKLKNGIKYITQDSKLATSIIIMFKVGSRNEPEGYYGMAHFVEHMIFKATKNIKKQDYIIREVSKLGGYINAFTDKDMTAYYVKMPTDNVEKIIKIMADMIFNSLFLSKDIIIEKKIVISELDRSLSNYERLMDDVISELLYHGSSIAHSTSGNRNDIIRFDREMIFKFLNKNYIKDNMIITLIGNNNIKMLEKHFGNKKFRYKSKKDDIICNPIPYIQQNEERFQHIIKHDAEQAFVTIAVPSYGIKDKRFFVVDLIGTILAGNMSSRLFIELREKHGLVYSVRKGIDKYEEIGALKIIFGTKNDYKSVNKCVTIVLKEFDKLKKELVGKDEIKNMKQYKIGLLKLSQDNTESVGLFIGINKLFMGEAYSYEYYIKQYEKITAKDIKEVANDIFRNDKLNIAIISKNI